MTMIEKIFLNKRAEFNKSSEQRLAEMGEPEGVFEYRDVSYADDSKKEHTMDIFVPKVCGKDKLPVIINVHGGGMIMGNKEFNRYFCAKLCKKGFLVFSAEYSLVPEVKVFTQFMDVSMALEKIKSIIPEYNGDLEHVYLTADSGGAYIALYASAMIKNKKLAEVAGVIPSTMDIKAIGLISGMFYTTRFDSIGLFMPNYLYGRGYKKTEFAAYINPENEAVAKSLPPAILVTSSADNLKKYTLDYAEALKRNGMECELLYFKGDKKLTHAFSVFYPDMEESNRVFDTLTEYFNRY